PERREIVCPVGTQGLHFRGINSSYYSLPGSNEIASKRAVAFMLNAQEKPERAWHERRALIEAIVASTVGTTIEWYDFFLYGTAAALVFPKLFFPELDPYVGQMAAFSTFTVGFLARPLGGVIFGYFGDRFGRKSSLVATLLLMGISTLLIGFLPAYEQ